MKQKVIRIDQSPLNKLRWQLTLECGHEEWITRASRPSPKTAECTKCKHT